MFEIEKPEKPLCYKHIKKLPCQYRNKEKKLNVWRSFGGVGKENLILYFALKLK